MIGEDDNHEVAKDSNFESEKLSAQVFARDIGFFLIVHGLKCWKKNDIAPKTMQVAKNCVPIIQRISSTRSFCSSSLVARWRISISIWSGVTLLLADD
jgi:hypothetical protein